jgi:AraC-like DNA-binding protein
MRVEKQTIIDAVELGYELDAGKPVLSYNTHIYNGMCGEAHAHPRAQLIYASKGVTKVITPDSVWMVTPLQAIWVPGMVEHQVCFVDHVEVRNVFLDPSVTSHLPATCFAFDVSSFFRELVLRIMQFDTTRIITAAEQRILQVLLDEICCLQPARLNLPIGKDARLHIITDTLIRNVGRELTLEEAAALACVSSRTLSRLFVAETGMTYRDWCIKLKLLEAIRRLSAGDAISTIAYELGYESASAFTFMFRKSLGKTPGEFVRSVSGEW